MTYTGFSVGSCFSPLDALHEAAAVADALEGLIGAAENLDGFSTTDPNSSRNYGLCLILLGISKTVNSASDAIRDGNSGYVAVKALHTHQKVQDMCRERYEAGYAAGREDAMGDDHGETAESSSQEANARRIEARETAVLAAVQSGFAVDDVSQALNLKKREIQRILGRAKQATGDLATSAQEASAQGDPGIRASA